MGKFCFTVFIVILLSLLMFSDLTAVIQCVSTNPSINVPYSANAPILDSQWTTSTEWTDSSEYKLSNQGSTAYIRAKQNSSFLFILVDFVSDQTGSASDSISTFDYCGLFFDVSNDGGLYPKSDDYFLSHYYISSTSKSGLITYISQGIGLNKEGNNWREIYTPQGFILNRGFSSINDPYESTKNHRIYESSIPLSFFNGNITGFYVFVRDANTGLGLGGTLLEFPIGAGGKSIRSDSMAYVIAPAPEKWGNLVFNQSSISPTPVYTPTLAPTPTSKAMFDLSTNEVLLIIMVAIGIIIVVLLISKKTNKNLY
jgi:hypothetical protein